MTKSLKKKLGFLHKAHKSESIDSSSQSAKSNSPSVELQNNKLNKTSATRFSQNQKTNNKMSKTNEMKANSLPSKDNLESNQFEVMSYTLESPINKWEKSQFRNLKSCKGPNEVKLSQCYKVNMVA